MKNREAREGQNEDFGIGLRKSTASPSFPVLQHLVAYPMLMKIAHIAVRF